MLSELIDTMDYFDPVEELHRLDELGIMEMCNGEEIPESDSGRHYWEIQGSIADCWESERQTCRGTGVRTA